MKALISPIEKVTDYQGNIGERVAQVEPDDKTFPIAHPLFWTDCPDDCVQDQWYYINGSCQPLPQPPET
ncbi:MAG: hypothetical protein EBU90_16950 [Proteobacteria bacterium]|nr:hypothetical protein [Pseudomonadota bacterium]